MATNSRSKIIIISVVLLIALLVVLAFLKSNKEDRTNVSVENVMERDLEEVVGASGKIFPVTEVKISSDVSGEIIELNVEEGDSVFVGQVLAKIDPDAYQSQVERGMATVNTSKAQLANSRAQVENVMAQKEQIATQLKNARDIHQRNEKLYEQGVISQADFEASLTNLESFEANMRSSEASIRSAQQSVEAAVYSVKSSEASLKEIQTNLKRTTIYSPVNGVVSLLNVEKGERVVGTVQMTGTELMRLANLNAMEVQVEVSENDIPRVNMGDKVDIEVDAYIGRTFTGKVRQIANSANNLTSGSMSSSLTSDQVTNFVVTIDILPDSYNDLVTKDHPHPFRPGMSASVDIYTDEALGVPSIPVQCVTTRELEDIEDFIDTKEVSLLQFTDDEVVEVVFVVRADSIGIVPVKTGLQDDKYIQVLSGLNLGDVVVSAPYSAITKTLKPGDKIEEVEEDDLYRSRK